MGTITARDVDEEVFRKFKAVVVQKGMKTGTALTQAVRGWIKEEGEKKKKKTLKITPWDWGPGHERDSERVDEVLYGWKK